MNSTHLFTLKKQERLRSRKEIQEIFRTGKALNAFPLKVLYLFSKDRPAGLQAAFGVSTRNFKKATQRNHVKRMLRESYRHEAPALKQKVRAGEVHLALFFIYKAGSPAEMPVVAQKMREILQKLDSALLLK